MARAGGGVRKSGGSAAKEIAALRRQLRAAERRIASPEKRLRELSKVSDASRPRPTVLFEGPKRTAAATPG